MNVFRHSGHGLYRRGYATAARYVPPASTLDMEKQRRPEKPRPDSPAFYTGRGAYFDQLLAIEEAIKTSRRALTSLQLYPLPNFALASLETMEYSWRKRQDLSFTLQAPLSVMRYRRIMDRVRELTHLQRIALTAGVDSLSDAIGTIISMFEIPNKESILAAKRRKPVSFDQYGRTYTLGRRKTSAARVWMIPVKHTDVTVPSPSFPSLNLHLGTDKPVSPDVAPPSNPKPSVHVATGTVLVNNRPLAEYFPLPADREKIIRPFKLTGVLGAYNVFAIVRGGGTTGQSGAISLAIAKGLAAHEPSIEYILKKAKLLRRDPRMVERKKTGLAKARKRYTWVKR